MTKKMTEKRYAQRLQTLVAAMEYARKGDRPVYDLGPGERHQRAIQEFSTVAKAESIGLSFIKRNKSLVLLFPDVEEAKSEAVVYRVKRGEQVIEEGGMDLVC